jgi:hypothetical protein
MPARRAGTVEITTVCTRVSSNFKWYKSFTSFKYGQTNAITSWMDGHNLVVIVNKWYKSFTSFRVTTVRRAGNVGITTVCTRVSSQYSIIQNI